MCKTIGVFYDGNSSVPQQIELSLDKGTSIFYFESPKDSPVKWRLESVSFEKKSGALYLQYGDDPVQSIVIKDLVFIQEITLFRKNNGHVDWYHKLLDLGLTSHAIFTLFIMVFIGLSYVYAIPWVAEKSVVLIPEDYDDKLGSNFFEENMLFNSVDSAKTEALNLFAKELKLKNTKPIKFTVVDSDIVNAFALPDGNIVVYKGILDEMKSYEELVALIGHEVAHVNNRHSIKAICRSLSGYLFVSAILGDANGIMTTIGDNVNSLQSLSFSREFEHQADLDGFEILVSNGVNPQGMSDLFKRLQHQNAIVIPEFLSSHPLTKERISYIDEIIKTKSFKFKTNSRLESIFEKLKK
ncbi:M48 family metallopeptidase [Flavobacterium sp. W1B]|uniref:M48 family metallopeptidase n=1 Tax=Flavobacterium sp. W1B TaxID=3394146 RepID=UPI0039BC26C5